jgi:hypothetical protein
MENQGDIQHQMNMIISHYLTILSCSENGEILLSNKELKVIVLRNLGKLRKHKNI